MMVPPPNAEGVLGETSVLTVAGLTGIQIDRFIEYRKPHFQFCFDKSEQDGK